MEVENIIPGDTPMNDLVDRIKGSENTETDEETSENQIRSHKDVVLLMIQNTRPFLKFHQFPKEQYVRLGRLLMLLVRDALDIVDEWSNEDAAFDDRRSFSTFQWLLQCSGLDWHDYIVSEVTELNVSNQPEVCPDLTSDRWDYAIAYYGEIVSLKQLLQRICSKPGNDFCQEQARQLASFLDPLIMMLQEHRVIACSFSEDLEQLKKSCADSVLAISSNVVDDDGDWDKRPFMLPNHPMDYYTCQKHLFDSLEIMSRESSWWLKKYEASHSSHHLLVEQSRQILELTMLYVPKFKKAKESLDRYLLDKNCPYSENEMKQLDLQSREILSDFEKRIKYLQKLLLLGDDKEFDMKDLQKLLRDEKEFVPRVLLGCFAYAVNKGKSTLDAYNAKRSGDISSYQQLFVESHKETAHLLFEVAAGLRLALSINFNSRDPPFACITYWRVVFHTPLLNVRLDLIVKKIGETTRLGLKILNSVANQGVISRLRSVLNILHGTINKLLEVGKLALVDFINMHEKVAQVIYYLGDAFTNGFHRKDYNDLEMQTGFNFPWDEHNVPDEVEIDFNDPKTELLDVHPSLIYGPDSDDEFI